MLKEKVDTEFCGLSDEEKKLIEEKEEDIKLDFDIRYNGYENIYEVFNDYGLSAILEILEEHLPFIKEQKAKILLKYEEDESVTQEFLSAINDVFFSLPMDVENINPKFFERIKTLSMPTEIYKCLINDVFDALVYVLSQKDVEEKVEIIKLLQNRKKVEDQSDKDI